MPTVAPYGAWRSPISARQVASGGGRRSGALLAADGALWWAELRPDEGGRTALMRRPEGGAPEEATPAGANARTRVHEYGGGAWTLAAPDVVVYVEFGDQRLYRRRLGTDAVAITPEPEGVAALQYADMRLAPDGETLVCVREIHPAGGGE
ncbi:MAG TPA: hypothetical protein VEB65_12230, partial [Solirubrobacterales bacterium]|nr:hypothetical protein [Solirubrobacterales bacterium]